MSALEDIRKYHENIVGLSQVIEKETLRLLEREGQLSRNEYLATVLPNRGQFKTGLFVHFLTEEMALFPILLTKDADTCQAVFNLLVEHAHITEKFREFENSTDYEGSVATLKDLFPLLIQHAAKEDGLLSRSVFTPEQEDLILKVCNIVDGWPPIVPY